VQYPRARHPKIDAAVRERRQSGARDHLGSSNHHNDSAGKRLVDIAPPGLNHVFFSDDGALRSKWPQDGAAILAAKDKGSGVFVWTALRTPAEKTPTPLMEKTCYVALGEAYHGDTLGCVSVGGIEQFPRDVSTAAVRRRSGADARQLSMPDGVTRKTSASIIWTGWNFVWPSITTESPLW